MNAGGIGDFSAFSFQGAKLLVTGEGGMLTTNNKNEKQEQSESWKWWFKSTGYSGDYSFIYFQ